MPTKHNPRRGSLQFWPRKRSKRVYARVRSWISKGDVKLLGFAGYKVGMRHVMLEDNRPNALTKGETVNDAVTIIECPPMKVYGIRFYKKTNDGLDVIGEVFGKADKELKRKLKASKKSNEPKEFDDVRVVVYTQPKLTGVGKKKPEVFELAIGGDNKEEKLKFAKELIGKEIKVSDIFKNGQFVDVHSVTKGRGFQGVVKIFGVPIRQHKSEKTKRGVGTLGAWTPKKTSFRVAQAKKHGYYMRTEYNKMLYKIGSNVDEINVKSGYGRYGVVKNDYLLVKGSVAGPSKRIVILTEPIRQTKHDREVVIKSVI